MRTIQLINFILISAFCLILLPQSLSAQEIKNARATLENGKVHVTYDLISDKEDFSYEVLLYSSSNSYRSPLSKVTGDIGKKVEPGINKLAIWDAKAELVKFKGEVTIRVEVKVIAPFISFRSPSIGESFKRGKSQNIQWEGGPTSGSLRIELMQGNTSMQDIGYAPNNGSFNWLIPANVKPGNYKIKVSQGSNESLSKDFAIKRKIPLGVKLLPLVAVGGVAVLLSGGGSGGEETPVDDPGIPDPPNLQ